MTDIAFLGLGAMGARMAANLLADGHAVTVWNRSDGPIRPLVDAGARRAATPRAAAKDAEIVFSMVRDDAASRSVWLDLETGALEGLSADAVAIDCSTVSVSHARAVAEAMAKSGRAFLDAPVAGSPDPKPRRGR